MLHNSRLGKNQNWWTEECKGLSFWELLSSTTLYVSPTTHCVFLIHHIVLIFPYLLTLTQHKATSLQSIDSICTEHRAVLRNHKENQWHRQEWCWKWFLHVYMNAAEFHYILQNLCAWSYDTIIAIISVGHRNLSAHLSTGPLQNMKVCASP
jgi:hypothetical protein